MRNQGNLFGQNIYKHRRDWPLEREKEKENSQRRQEKDRTLPHVIQSSISQSLGHPKEKEGRKDGGRK